MIAWTTFRGPAFPSQYVPAGPTSHLELAAFVGEVIGPKTRVVGTCVYLTPSHTAYELQDGRVAKLTDRVAGRQVTIFPDFLAYRACEDATWGGYDPETGRWKR